jgi:uncharacterized protein
LLVIFAENTDLSTVTGASIIVTNMDINLFAVFTTGLLTGGFTCIAVQGGLLTSALAQPAVINKQKAVSNLLPTVTFIGSKLIAYTILGFLLGWVGSQLQVSIQTRIILQLVVVIFMLGTALNLLNVHPVFRFFLIKPPIWALRLADKEASSRSLFAPAFLGFLTVLIPCGATQAMMALAVGTGQPVWGALVMFAFVLGTSPVFFLLGLATVEIKSLFNKQFAKIAAFAIILLALFNLDSTLALANSRHTIRSVLEKAYCVFSYCDLAFSLDPVTEQTITFSPTGYSPSRFTVRAGEEITLNLVNEDASGCIQSFTISALNIQEIVHPDESKTITFTAPSEPGRINFTCSSGLYPGTIDVI